MSAEIWAIVTVGIAILVAIAASNRAMRREMSELRQEMNGHIAELRREMNERFEEVGKRFGEVNERITAVRLEMLERFGEVNERIAAARLEMLERFGEVGERLGRVEGLLEGMGFAQRKRAAKERSDGER